MLSVLRRPRSLFRHWVIVWTLISYAGTILAQVPKSSAPADAKPAAKPAAPAAPDEGDPYPPPPSMEEFSAPWTPPDAVLTRPRKGLNKAPPSKPVDLRYKKPEKPTAENLRASRVLAVPLQGRVISMAGLSKAARKKKEAAVEAETRQMAATLETYQTAGGRYQQAGRQALQGFFDQHPQGVYRVPVGLELGDAYWNAGYWVKAIEIWEAAWAAGKDVPRHEYEAFDLADAALARLLRHCGLMGRVDRLRELVELAKSRTLGREAANEHTNATEALWYFDNRAEHNIACAFSAHNAICVPLGHAALFPDVDDDAEIRGYLKNGISLSDIARRSRESGSNLRVIKRTDAAAVIPVPSIIHWSFGHYSALMERNEAGEVRVADPGMKFQGFLSPEAVQAQASGYFLIPASAPLPAGFAAVSEEEAGRHFGRHCSHESSDQGCNPKKGCGGDGHGMPVVDVTLYRPGFTIRDVPLSYPAPLGDGVQLELVYESAAPRVPGYTSKTSFGSGWTHGFDRYLRLVGSSVELVIDGSYFTYTANGSGGFNKPLTRNDMPGLTRQADGTYYLTYDDGTKDYFTRPNTSPATEYWWTGHTALDGSEMQLGYDPQGRLEAITDPSGRVVTLSYTPLAGDAALGRTNLVRKAIDPYLRETLFTYHESGCLKSITDPVGILTTFSDFLGNTGSMTTPYGTTSFIADAPGTGRTGSVTITYPNGDKEYVLRNHLPPTQVTNVNGTQGSPWEPGGMKLRHWGAAEHQLFSDPDGLPPTTIGGVSFIPKTYHLDYRNTFHWDRQAMQLIEDDIQAGRLPQGSLDYNYATIRNWASDGYNAYLGGKVHPVLSSIKHPGQSRVYFNYPGQAGDSGIGTLSTPDKIVRQVENASGTPTWTIQTSSYHPDGRPISSTDVLGRTTQFGYDGVDLSSTTLGGEVQFTASSFTTPLRQPQHIEHADGSHTDVTYNAKGQPRLVTHAKGASSQAVRYTYDTAVGKQGNLLSIEVSKSDAPGGFVTTTSLSYDDYNRVRRRTDLTTGYAVQYDYDNLDRPTRVTHPDGTTEDFTYRNLDLFAMKDRQGLWTRHFYNSMRQLEAAQDPAGRTTRFEWCRCGDLRKIIDPMGKTTWFKRDNAGRVVEKELPDGKVYKMTYQPLSGRLATLAYPADVQAGRITLTRRYFTDGALAAIDYRDGTLEDVAFQYDPQFPRLTQRTDGSGSGTARTTRYSYVPLAANGYGQAASIDGPLPDDTIYRTYDGLGRLSRSIIAADASATTAVTHSQSYAFDTLGRLDAITNGLGSFDHTYATGDISGRLQSVRAPGGLVSSYSYHPVPAFGSGSTPRPDAGQLQAIHHQRGGVTLSRHRYAYDLSGRITGWEKQLGADAAATRTWALAHNRSSELTKVTQSGDAAATWDYQYDPSGNRLMAAEPGSPATYWQHNARNQTTQIGGGGSTLIEGTVDEYATVTVNGQAAELRSVPGTSQFSFQHPLPLQQGGNAVSITATDRNGNARTQNYQVTAGPQQAQPAYDVNGNLLSTGGIALQPGGSPTARFEWDAVNRLTAWQEHAVPQEGTRRTEWRYNGLGLRERQVEKVHQGGAWATQSTRAFVWDGHRIAQERDGAGTAILAAHYPQGERRHAHAASGQVAATLLYTWDHLGSVREVVDVSTPGAGAVAARFDYSAYGQRSRLDSGTVEIRHGYTGHWEHAASGLTVAPYRSYSAVLGRWLNEDPLGEEGGLNLYGYVGNGPVMAVDLLGLSSEVFTKSYRGIPPFNGRPGIPSNTALVFYDGRDRGCNGTASGIAFGSYARAITYGSTSAAIDISQPGWERILESTVRMHGQFDRVIIADHGYDGMQNWVDDLDFLDVPEAFRAVDQAIKPGGKLVLAGCNVASDVDGNGSGYLQKVSKAFGPKKWITAVGYTGAVYYSTWHHDGVERSSTYGGSVRTTSN